MKTFEIKDLVRPHIAALKPYSSARNEYTGKEGIFLDANENPFGSVNGGDYNRYPDPLQRELKRKFSSLKKISEERIFLGSGSDEAIDLLFRAFTHPGQDNVIILPPTYGMYEVSAAINDVEVRKASLTADFQIDVDRVFRVLDEHSKMVFICHPNNPSGNLMDRNAICQILERFEGLVVVDEAYIDFAKMAGNISLLDQFPNLVVLQTLSKAWGLAALRLGIAYASKEIVDILSKIKPPYNISKYTQDTALIALDKEAEKDQMVEEIIRQREFLTNELAKLSLISEVYRSDANFLLVRVNKAKQVYDYLVEKKIIIRDRSKVILCEECLRITIGTAEENRALLDALEAYKNT